MGKYELCIYLLGLFLSINSLCNMEYKCTLSGLVSFSPQATKQIANSLNSNNLFAANRHFFFCRVKRKHVMKECKTTVYQPDQDIVSRPDGLSHRMQNLGIPHQKCGYFCNRYICKICAVFVLLSEQLIH